jgi:DNA primase
VPDFSQVDVKVFLTELGMKNIREDRTRRGIEVRFSCPFPGHAHGDQNPSATMNAESTAYRCWGCGMKGNATTFLAELENVSPLQAAEWIRIRFEGGWKELDPGGLWAELKNILFREVEGVYVPEPIEERFASEFRVDWQKVKLASNDGEVPSPLAYMLDRFEWQTLEEWDVGYDPKSSRLTIPVRDHNGRLMGFKARAWWPDAKPKYIVIGNATNEKSYGFEAYDATLVVFGLDRAIPHCAQQLVLVEGELNTIAMHEHGFLNTAGISGQFIDAVQARIVRHFTESVTLLFDDPVKARLAAEHFEGYVKVRVCLEHEGDPNTMTRADIDELIGGALSPLIFDLA